MRDALRGETEPAGELFVGRAEHVASGTAARFSSADESIACFSAVYSSAPTNTATLLKARGSSDLAGRRRAKHCG